MTPTSNSVLQDRHLFCLLTAGFVLFYAVQVPLATSSADVVAFALRSNAPKPIFAYAYLDARTLQDATPLPNYHLAHTVALWVTYKCFPAWLRQTAAPAGFFSALCGGLVVGLSYLIWLRSGWTKKEAVAAAGVVGFVPSFWYHSLIGEVYLPQIFGVILCVALFLYSRPILAGMALSFAALISPLAVFCFPLLFLAGWSNKRLGNALVVGVVTLVGYAGCHWAIGSNPLGFLQGTDDLAVGKSLLFRLLSLGGIIVLNLHFLLVPLAAGWRTCWRRGKTALVALSAVVGLHLLLPVLSADFLLDKGCFLLPVFWAVSLPLGVGIARSGLGRWSTLGLMLVTVLIMETVWLLPAQRSAKLRSEAGSWLRGRFGQEIKVMGDWGTALPIAAEVSGWEYESVATHFYDVDYPSTGNFFATGEDSLLVAIGRKPTLRRWASRIPLPGFRVSDYVPEVPPGAGNLEQVFTNNSFTVYLWSAP